MPNWCSNVVVISHVEPSKLDVIRNAVKAAAANRGEYFFNGLVPRPLSEAENWYNWNGSNWGTKWDVEPQITEDNGDSITLSFDTAWAPPIEFYNEMVNRDYMIRAFYYESGMAFAGIYDNGDDDYYEYGGMDSDEVADTLPSELDEMFCISEQMSNWESENEEDNDGQPDEAQEWHDYDADC
jgi:hypothetical protein